MKNPVKVDKHNLTTAEKKTRRKHKKAKIRAMQAKAGHAWRIENSQGRREEKRKIDKQALNAASHPALVVAKAISRSSLLRKMAQEKYGKPVVEEKLAA